MTKRKWLKYWTKLNQGIGSVQFLGCFGLSCTLVDEIGKTLIITTLEFYRLKISSLLLGRLYHFCGVVFLWPLMRFSKLTILHFPCFQTSLPEMWPRHLQNMALLRKAKRMMIVMPWLEMQLLESFLTFFYTVPEKKSAVPELSGCYHLQCMLAITQPFNKCFLKFRFAIPLQVKNIFSVIFPPFTYLWELLVCIVPKSKKNKCMRTLKFCD